MKLFFKYYYLAGITFFLCVSVITIDAYAGGPVKYDVSPFANQYWCTTVYPTAYVNVGIFSIFELDVKGFDKNQLDNIILTLPAGFEFNPAAPHSVTFIPAKDITSLVLNSVTATQITITIDTDGVEDEIDAILFNDFEIRAVAAGAGDLLRGDGAGGTFEIDGDVDNPTNLESLGNLYANTPMLYDSSQVYTASTAIVRKQCPTDHEILEIEISVTDTCPATITRFDFNTSGSTFPLGDIVAADVFYTGETKGFTTANLFGTVAGPNGAFAITGSQDLTTGPGHYYFYLAYDITPGAAVGNFLDARLDSFVFTGSTKSDMDTPDPAGNRTITNDICVRPDLPNPTPNPDTIYTGSLIIPMDTANQSYVGGTIFNLKAYGLVHDLLMNDVPIKWIIRSGKARNDTDFAATTRRVWPDTTVFSSKEYRASAFVIDTPYINSGANQFVKSARQVINDYGNNVEVHELGADEVLDVRYILTQRPKIAVFDNGKEEDVHIAVLDSGGVTNYFTVGAGVFTGIDSCFTFCSEPHWGGGLSDSAITNNVKKFISEGGNFLAQCKGIDTYENYSIGNIVSTNGMSIVNNKITHQYLNADLAYMQFLGDIEEDPDGSEKDWELAPGSSWRSGFYYCVSSTVDIDNVAASGAHMVAPDSVGGNVFYLGGHDHSPFNNLLSINAGRMYLNASLIPAGKPTDFALDPGDTSNICLGDSVQLGGSPTGPAGATYEWIALSQIRGQHPQTQQFTLLYQPVEVALLVQEL